MDKLKFYFVVGSKSDGKTNANFLTSICTENEEVFLMPEELQWMDLHLALQATTAYARVKKTLRRGHQKASIWIPLTEELIRIYLDVGENLIFGDLLLDKKEENLPVAATSKTSRDELTEILRKLVDGKNNNHDITNLNKISQKFLIDKFSNKNTSNANQWINEFESECARFNLNTDKQNIEIFKLLLEKNCSDWYKGMLIKLTIDSDWKKWKKNFIETYANKGLTPIRYAIGFKYQSGGLLDYAVKKERLLLEVRRSIDTGTLIDLIAAGLPNFISDKIDRESIVETEDLYNELGKLEHLSEKKKFIEKSQIKLKVKQKEHHVKSVRKITKAYGTTWNHHAGIMKKMVRE